MILGPAGAGKTTLAEGIARRTGVPLVHLDLLFWREGWTPTPRAEARRALLAAIKSDRWILDGNFLPDEGEEDARFDRADAVIFLDVPRRTCLYRVLRRLVRDCGGARADLPEGCSEGFDFSLLRWIWRYPAVDRPRVLGILERLDGSVAVHHLHSRGEAQRLVETL